MGNQLVHHVEALLMDGQRTKGLSPSARVVLLIMAADAHDTGTTRQAPAIYYRGWPHLGRMLGYDTWDDRAERAVARAVAQLVGARLVERDDDNRPTGWFAAGYRLTL
jgi:hypothetical protein